MRRITTFQGFKPHSGNVVNLNRLSALLIMMVVMMMVMRRMRIMIMMVTMMVRMIVMMRKMKTFNGWVQTNCWQRCHLKRSTIWSPFIMNTQHCFQNLHEHSDFQAKKPQKNPLSRLVGGSLLTMEEDTAIGFARTVKS